MAMTVRFQYERETKNALRFAEVDDKGDVVEMAWAKIGALYIRKSSLLARGEPFPHELKVTVELIGTVEP
jgi:hypothetical protein